MSHFIWLVRYQRCRLFSISRNRGMRLTLLVALVIGFGVAGWSVGSSVESASTPVQTCGIGIAPCLERTPVMQPGRVGLAETSGTRYRSVIPISARGINLTASHFDRISVIIPATGGTVTASDQSFTLIVPAGVALDPAGNPRNVKLVVEQITPPEDSQMVGFWAARAFMIYEDGWLVDPQALPVDIIIRFRQDDLLRLGAGSSLVYMRMLVNGVQWTTSASTIDLTRFEARMSTNKLSSLALAINRLSPGPTVPPPPVLEALSPSPTQTPRPQRTLTPTSISGPSTATPSFGGVATLTATPPLVAVATSTVTPSSEEVPSSTPTLPVGAVATTSATQLSGGLPTSTASPTSLGAQTSTPTATPRVPETSTRTPSPSATIHRDSQTVPNPRFGFIIGSITDDNAITNVLSQTGAGAWIPYDDLRVSGPSGRMNLIRTGANRQPASFDTLIQEVARGRPGAYWLIGNEPNVPGQDFDGQYLSNGRKNVASLRASATRYVEAFRHYRTLVRNADPTAHIVFGNFLNFDATCEGCGGFFSTREYLDEVQLAFQREWGEEIPADVIWGIHVYVINWLQLPMIDNAIVSREISLLRAYIDTVASRRGSPIWLTEFGIIWGYQSRCAVGPKIANCPDSPYPEQMAETYLSTTLDWLTDNALSMRIDRWFLFANYALPEPFATVYGGISLVDGPGPASLITRFGRAYREYSQRGR